MPADPILSEVKLGPSGRIILQDLNVALSSNFREKKFYPSMSEFVADIEKYRQWLVDLLKSEYVILCTARSERFRDATLESISSKTGWLPQQSYFNRWLNDAGDGPLEPHLAKKRYLTDSIFPRYGHDPSLYFGIDSFGGTRSMYQSLDIECRDANRDDSKPWSALLPKLEP
ncbi:MAG: hypothetical protein HOE14_10905 [Gemmatimonadales bacterium]|nr:hypothetical protein [Gemmatimonadales bacterium]MBT7692515.1 hypothetical protein [Gemmatimonadales bacterium]